MTAPDAEVMAGSPQMQMPFLFLQVPKNTPRNSNLKSRFPPVQVVIHKIKTKEMFPNLSNESSPVDPSSQNHPDNYITGSIIPAMKIPTFYLKLYKKEKTELKKESMNLHWKGLRHESLNVHKINPSKGNSTDQEFSSLRERFLNREIIIPLKFKKKKNIPPPFSPLGDINPDKLV
ncbi:hypothetical protein SADUNF_Sadunf17G0109000 [Salix dunnii]|uniref:Uncharacterized protein n=1 Tax=Salix dunnii TaxID=1413687 RepID=A0A835J721_9ROSI|nr:hypothetical protein SADUNF_Sadunf17G0109000 [Salix dunnii]